MKAIFNNRKLAHGLLVSLLLLAAVRLFYYVPTPGVDTGYFKDLFSKDAAFGLLDMITGSGMSRLSVMTLNITPYITASIIMQLLGNMSERIKEMQSGMKDEQQLIRRLTVILAVAFALAEAIFLAVGYGRQGLFIDYSWYWVTAVAVVWAAGTAAVSMIGLRIQDAYGFNGISLILLGNILSGYPSDAYALYKKFLSRADWAGKITAALIILFTVAVMYAAAYFIQETEDRIKVVYTGISGTKTGKGDIPVKLCPGSVLPVVFASSLMTMPGLIASAFTKHQQPWMKLLDPGAWFRPGDMSPSFGVLAYMSLIFAFSFLYIDMGMSPEEMSERINKNGGTVPGLRPGRDTAAYLRKRISRTVLLGACAISALAVVPVIISGLLNLPQLSFFGTGVIIVVGILSEAGRHVRAGMQKGLLEEKGGGLF